MERRGVSDHPGDTMQLEITPEAHQKLTKIMEANPAKSLRLVLEGYG